MDNNKPSLAWINVAIPERKLISEIFKNYRDVEIDILNFLPYDFEKNIGNVIFEIRHYRAEKIIENVKAHPSVSEFSVLEKEENRVIFNIKTKNPDLLYGIIKCGVLIEFPVKAREGIMEWKLISTRKRIDDLLIFLEQKGIDFSLLRIGTAPYFLDNDNKNKLSFEESKILNAAINSGFFEVPRRISLEAFAESLGKSKSHTSVLLRKIIKKKVMLEV